MRIWPIGGSALRPDIAAQKKADRLSQVIEIQLVRPEDPFEWDRPAYGRSRSLEVIVRIGIRPRLAVSHGRVRFDTHNDLRLAVDALSGGECC